MASHVYPSELQLNNANVSDTEASCFKIYMYLYWMVLFRLNFILNEMILIFDIMVFTFLDGDVPRSTSEGVYISQLIRIARVSSHVNDFYTRNKVLTAKFLKQEYTYHKLCRAFSNFYRRDFDLVSKYNVGLNIFLLQGLSGTEFCGYLMYKFRKIIDKKNFPYNF